MGKGIFTTPPKNILDLSDLSDCISDAFDASKTYAVGDFCIYNNQLYKCITAIETAGDWNETCWGATSISKEFTDLGNSLGTQVEFLLDGTTLNITTKEN